MNRRSFVTKSMLTLTAVTGTFTAHAAVPFLGMTIREALSIIKSNVNFDEDAPTVDTVKCGDPDQPLTGIVTTMFATIDVIKRAVELKANLIIAHEPTFYNHSDETDWLEEHAVYTMKRELLAKNGIVVWRFHDYWHSVKPDGIFTGVTKNLQWEDFYSREEKVFNINAMTLRKVIDHVKASLNIPTLRFIGNPDQPCARIVLQPGAYGGRNHIRAIHERKPDLFICGELQEWETSEYIRDARALGLDTALIVLGHSVSEEPGMEWLVTWLQDKIKGTSIHHVPSGNPFQWA